MTEQTTEQFVTEVRGALHDLAQPLTALQCRLYLGTLAGGDLAEMQRTIHESLAECERMMHLARALSERLENFTGKGGSGLGRAA